MNIIGETRRWAAVALCGVLAVGALLTGCSSEPGELPPMPFDTVRMPDQTAPTASPGQHLDPGEIALLPQTDPERVAGVALETTVIGVAEGEPSYWDSFENGAEFEGDTPFFAVMQYRFVTGPVMASATPSLTPLLDDGTEGGTVQREYFGASTADTACPFEIGRFDLEEDRGPNEYIACVLYTAPVGSTVVGLGWYNAGGVIFTEPDPALNPYFPAPVVWDITRVAKSDPD